MLLFILLLGHTDNIVRSTKSADADTHVKRFTLFIVCVSAEAPPEGDT